MKEKEIFHILEIEPTKDKDAIKRAYLTKLSVTNPEDDQEGFKKLRQAYEEALILSDQEETEEKEKTPVDLWVDQVREVYQNIKKRIDKKQWRELFDQPICQDLDTSEEVCEALLVFLMDYFTLPQPIWELIDKEFCIVQNQEMWLEKFPKDFIDFVVREINGEEFFPFALLEGEVDADYDTYVRNYFGLKRKVEEKDFEEADKLLKELEESGITHPFVLVEKLKYAMGKEDKEDATKLLQEIVDLDINNDYIRYFVAVAKWELEDIEGAKEIWDLLIEKTPMHYGANLGLIKYYMKTEDYTKAKDKTLEMLEHYGNVDELLEYMRTCNTKIKDQLLAKCEDDEKQEAHLELGWCYYQNEEYEEGIKWLGTFSPIEEKVFEYTNLLGRTLIGARRHKEALGYILKWIDMILALKEDGTEKTANRIKRLPYAYYCASICYMEGENGPEYEQAIDCLDHAIERENNENDRLMYMERKAYCLLKEEENEKCIDVCNAILDVFEGYYPAYLHRQEAYFNLHCGQEVIDDFYRSKEIVANYCKPYELAAQVFYFSNQIEDSMDIINQAKENDTFSEKLRFLELKNQRQTARTNEDADRLIMALKVLIKETRQKLANHEDTQMEQTDIGNMYLEITLTQMDFGRYSEALNTVDTAISHNPEAYNYKWVKAQVYIGLEEYYDAVDMLRSVEENYSNSDNYYCDLAYCYSKLPNGIEKAEEYYKKSLKINPNNRKANCELADIYQDRFERTNDKMWYDLAVKYMEKQIELTPNCYYYVHRGLLYNLNYEHEKSLADYVEASKDRPEDIFPYNNAGYVYKIMGKYKEAEEQYHKAFEVMEDLPEERRSIYPYGNYYVLLLMTGRIREAEEILKKGSEVFSVQSFYDDYVELYGRTKQYDKAIEFITKFAEDEVQKYGDLSEVYRYKKDYKKAIYYGKKLIGHNKSAYSIARGCSCLIRAYKAMGDYKNVVAIARKALKQYSLTDGSAIYYIDSIRFANAMLGDKKEAQKYFEYRIRNIESRCKLADYLDYAESKMLRLYHMGMAYCDIGDVENAKKIYARMTCDHCGNCHYAQCIDKVILEGRIAEEEGRIEDAIACYKRAISMDHEEVSEGRLAVLEKKKK